MAFGRGFPPVAANVIKRRRSSFSLHFSFVFVGRPSIAAAAIRRRISLHLNFDCCVVVGCGRFHRSFFFRRCFVGFFVFRVGRGREPPRYRTENPISSTDAGEATTAVDGLFVRNEKLALTATAGRAWLFLFLHFSPSSPNSPFFTSDCPSAIHTRTGRGTVATPPSSSSWRPSFAYRFGAG